MQIFLDSTNIKEIEEIYQLGIIDGVTTNPSLFALTGHDFYHTASNICKLVQGDVSIEVIANDYKNMLIQGNKIAAIATNVTIKLPTTWEGIRACKYFRSQGISVNMTLCFSANQALLAAKVGANYISPFIGRLDDIGCDGMQLIKDIRKIFDNYAGNLNTKILAASIRNANHFLQAALIGVEVVTMPGKIIKQLLEHPLTTLGLNIFNKDWQKSGLNI